MKVLEHNIQTPHVHEFLVDVDGYRYILKEYLDRNDYLVEKTELQNEWGRVLEDKNMLNVVQKLVEKYLVEETQ